MMSSFYLERDWPRRLVKVSAALAGEKEEEEIEFRDYMSTLVFQSQPYNSKPRSPLERLARAVSVAFSDEAQKDLLENSIPLTPSPPVSPPPPHKASEEEMVLQRAEAIQKSSEIFGLIPSFNAFAQQVPGCNTLLYNLPTREEEEKYGLWLLQVQLSNGRHTLFQSLGNTTQVPNDSLLFLRGQYIVFGMDQPESFDIGVLLQLDALHELIKNLPTVPYSPVLRRATKSEIVKLARKEADEALAKKYAVALIPRKLVEVDACEFTLCRKRLIVFAKLIPHERALDVGRFCYALQHRIRRDMNLLTIVFLQWRT